MPAFEAFALLKLLQRFGYQAFCLRRKVAKRFPGVYDQVLFLGGREVAPPVRIVPAVGTRGDFHDSSIQA